MSLAAIKAHFPKALHSTVVPFGWKNAYPLRDEAPVARAMGWLISSAKCLESTIMAVKVCRDLWRREPEEMIE